ncbi:hypothetical protein KI387_005668, partial [Taxus chinensis]
MGKIVVEGNAKGVGKREGKGVGDEEGMGRIEDLSEGVGFLALILPWGRGCLTKDDGCGPNIDGR